MAITSGFYNSINGDRMYTAEQLSSIFEGLITDGIYNQVGEAFVVTATEGMTLSLGTGRAWLRGTWIKNDAIHLLELEASEVALNRYDAIVLRSDGGDDIRQGGVYIKKGTPASNPVYPEMDSGEYLKEIPLAYIYVGKNVSSISQSNITDMRGSASCPWVTGLITQVDTSTLWQQFKTQWEEFMASHESEADSWLAQEQADFLSWYNNLVDYINADIEAKLTNDVLTLQTDMESLQTDMESLQTDMGNHAKKATGTFDGLGWNSQDDGTYIQTITVNGVTANNDILITPATEYKEAYVAMGCEAIAQGANSITFRCTDPDDIDMVVGVIIFNL